MKYILSILFLFFCSNLSADLQGGLSVRSAIFTPSSKLFKKIYDAPITDYQLEAIFKIRKIYYWANLDWLSDKGRSISLNDPTKITIVNYSGGLKIPFCSCSSECLSFFTYLGFGPSLGRIHIKDTSFCGTTTTTKTAPGAVFKSGIYFVIQKFLFLDIFIDYLYQPVQFEKKVQIGGLKTGIGIGFGF